MRIEGDGGVHATIAAEANTIVNVEVRCESSWRDIIEYASVRGNRG